MKAKLVEFCIVDINGCSYNFDVVINKGKIQKRKKKPSKAFREQYGHTPLCAYEEIPWGGEQLIIGTGTYGQLPIMPGVMKEAKRHNTSVVAVPTDEASRLISELKDKKIWAVLHVTC